jgi:parallel beta-helix repeat protein
MRNGAGYVIYLSEQNILTGNYATSNSNDGVEVVDASSNRLSRNTANSNGGDGFNVLGTSELNTLDQNAACHNASVDAEDSSTGAGNTWLNNLFCTTSGI